MPNEIVPPTFTLEYNKDLLYAPTLVAVGREIDEIYLFDISLHHESDIELARNAKMEIYGPLVEAIKRQKTSSLVNLYTLEIGTSLGQMSETTKFSIWQFFRLTTKSTNMENIVTNIALLAKLSSFKLFKVYRFYLYNVEITTYNFNHKGWRSIPIINPISPKNLVISDLALTLVIRSALLVTPGCLRIIKSPARRRC